MMTDKQLRLNMMENMEGQVKDAARDAFNDVMDNRCPNPMQENARLKFITASARYLRELGRMRNLLNDPSIGDRWRGPKAR